MTQERHTILLVEDSPSDALLVRHSLRHEYDVDIASDGNEAMDRLGQGRYLFIIIDYKLPGMTGLELLAWMRSEGIKTPVIVVSGQGDERVAVDALKHGAYDYLIKSQDSITSLPIVARQALRRFELEQRNRVLSQIVENTDDAIVTVDGAGRIATANRAVERLFGLSPEEAVGQPFAALVCDEPTTGNVADILTRVRAGEAWKGALICYGPDGRRFPAVLSASALEDNGGIGQPPVIAIVSDMRDRQRLVDELGRLSITDELTGVANHRHFREQLRREFRRAKRYRHSLAAAIIDMDSFKSFNETAGSEVGDEVLRAVSAILRDNTREVDFVARYGGQAFAILLPNTNLPGARVCANKLREAIADACVAADGPTLRVTASIGLAALDETINEEDALLMRAGRALHTAKRKGRNTVCSWEDVLAEGKQGAQRSE